VIAPLLNALVLMRLMRPVSDPKRHGRCLLIYRVKYGGCGEVPKEVERGDGKIKGWGTGEEMERAEEGGKISSEGRRKGVRQGGRNKKGWERVREEGKLEN